ncbi:MAG: hypothetical protein ACRC67_14635 [Inquilinus sp.]|uniref:hypothetical protein n=1 Tax=Inquilinus sp. TaxID=1932117 RepID=UPI003F35F595
MVGVDWIADLERWLEPFVAGLGHKARRRMCPLYVVRIPMKPAMHSNSKSAGCSDAKPASIPI